MFDTQVTIVGNALNTPEWRRLGNDKAVVAKFKVAATSRRYDRDNGRWVDGASLRVRVNCWRRLAENVTASVLSGDPVIVTGRLYTRDWIGEDGQHRVSYELDAVAVGHDLARGQGKFSRQRRNTSTTMLADDPVEDEVRDGEVAPAPGAEVGTRAGETVEEPDPCRAEGRTGERAEHRNLDPTVDGPGGADGADGSDGIEESEEAEAAMAAEALAMLREAGLTAEPIDQAEPAPVGAGAGTLTGVR